MRLPRNKRSHDVDEWQKKKWGLVHRPPLVPLNQSRRWREQKKEREEEACAWIESVKARKR